MFWPIIGSRADSSLSSRGANPCLSSTSLDMVKACLCLAFFLNFNAAPIEKAIKWVNNLTPQTLRL